MKPQNPKIKPYTGKHPLLTLFVVQTLAMILVFAIIFTVAELILKSRG